MKRAVKQALDQCLARLEAGASIEECLHGQAELAAELRPLLETAQELRGRQQTIPSHSQAAFQRGRARMHAARAEQAAGPRTSPLAGFLVRPVAVVAVAASVAVLAALGFATDLFQFGAGTTSAVEGVVSRVGPDEIEITTLDGIVTFKLLDNTLVLDANGNPVKIVPGAGVRVETEDDDGSLSAQEIRLEDDDDDAEPVEVEFSGVLQAINGNTLTVEASWGTATVHIDAQTEVKGSLAGGVSVEIHATRQADGSYLASEVDAEDGGHDDGGDHDGGDDHDGSDDNSGTGSSNSGSGSDDSSGSGSSSDDSKPSGSDGGSGDDKKDDEPKDDD